MSLWSAHEAAEATGGRARRDWQASGVSIDTRTLAPGDLFVALTAERDGHDFVAKAFEAGASAAMVSRIPDGVPEDAPLLVVGDVLEGLAALGRAGRTRTGARVVAITGSAGKTSTKEMVRAVLAGQGKVHASVASYNNHWGVPLTLARMPRHTDFAIVEIGMNAPGEISPLSRLTRPHVAIVTTVAPAHLEAFSSIDGIAHEKASICDGLEPGGTAVLNGDLPTTPILEAAARRAGGRILRFGQSASAHHRLSSMRLAKDCTIGEGRAWRTPVLFKIPAAGRHFALNAMAVLATVQLLGADRARAICALAAWMPPEGRGLRRRIALDIVDDHLTVDLIDDAFNANPASLGAALEVLAAAEPQHGLGRVATGRRIAILGDMLELGADELELHAALARHPAMARVDRVHCVGRRMRALYDVLPEAQRGQWVADADDLVHRAHTLFDAGDVLLVKGSKGSRVARVVDAIRKLGHPAPNDRTGAE